MGNTANAYGELTFDDVYSFPADLNDLAAFVNRFANGRRGTSADRLALLPGQIRDGMMFLETDTGDVYLRRLGSWARVLGDTGWQNLPAYNTGWSTEGSDTPQYRVLNGVLYFRGRIDATSGAVQEPFTAALPTGTRPSRDMPVLVGVTSGGTPSHFVVVVGANGNITVFKGANVVADLALAGIPPIPLS